MHEGDRRRSQGDLTAKQVGHELRDPLVRDMRDIESSVAIGIPPFKFNNPLVAQVRNQIEEMMRNDQGGRGSSLALRLARDGEGQNKSRQQRGRFP